MQVEHMGKKSFKTYYNVEGGAHSRYQKLTQKQLGFFSNYSIFKLKKEK